MKKFRLKKEAVQFFKEKHSAAIYSLDTWKGFGVDVKALEEIEEAYITYGHEKIHLNSSSNALAGWSDEDGSLFHFTIHFPNTKYMQHDKFSDGRVIRELMDEIQSDVNKFCSVYLTRKIIIK